ncbi:hypothetical protein GCM10027347_61440 [Larkinella harenae]
MGAYSELWHGGEFAEIKAFLEEYSFKPVDSYKFDSWLVLYRSDEDNDVFVIFNPSDGDDKHKVVIIKYVKTFRPDYLGNEQDHIGRQVLFYGKIDPYNVNDLKIIIASTLF